MCPDGAEAPRSFDDAVVTVPFYDTQLAFVDSIATRGTIGSSREAAIVRVIVEHVADRLGGVQPFVGGTTTPDVLKTSFPGYGPTRFETVLEPVTGVAVPVLAGEVLRIEQVVGGTCVDFNAFNLHDYKEVLDCGFTRSFQSFDPRRGEFIWTNAPRGRPMFAIMEMPDTCELDIVGHRCNRILDELGWGLPDHANCQDTLAEAIREYGLTPDDVHDSFNLWMATTIDEHGRRQFRWNPGREGDRVELLAIFDVLAAQVICGLGDLVGINNFTFAPIKVEVLKATEETQTLVAGVVARWGSMRSQVRTADLADVAVRAQRALERDPAYVPAYRRAPALTPVDVLLPGHVRALLAALIESGVYGDTEGEAVRATCMRWCNRHVTQVRRPKIEFL
jgi:uncharacterized protein